jgi:non-repetitive/WGA-negative nucleoporin
VLGKLAERRDASVTLEDRLKFLSLALSNAKSAEDGAGFRAVELARELEEKMEVAEVQLKARPLAPSTSPSSHRHAAARRTVAHAQCTNGGLLSPT